MRNICNVFRLWEIYTNYTKYYNDLHFISCHAPECIGKNILGDAHIVPVLLIKWIANETYHHCLPRIPAPVGSQEVVEHTNKLALLIGQCFPWCRLGRYYITVSDPTCTTFYYPTCTYLLSEVGKPLTIASLPATKRVQEFLILPRPGWYVKQYFGMQLFEHSCCNDNW